MVPDAPAAVPSADIASAGPLTHIWVGNDLSCQVQHIADGTVHEFFPQDIIPGDCGTFIAMDGVLYAPDFQRTARPPRTASGANTLVHPDQPNTCDRLRNGG